MVVMRNQAWSISRFVLTDRDGKALHLVTVCSWFIFVCVCVRVCVRVCVCVCVCERERERESESE